MEEPAAADLDRLFQGLDYSMFVVTAADGEEADGCLVGFVTQASLDPQRLLVCLSTANRTYELARKVHVLAVHVLGAEQHELAALFGGATGDVVDKLARCRWEAGPAGVPILSDSAGWMVGTVLERIPLGDHVGFLLEPLDVHRAGNDPVLTYQQVKDISPGHPA